MKEITIEIEEIEVGGALSDVAEALYDADADFVSLVLETEELASIVAHHLNLENNTDTWGTTSWIDGTFRQVSPKSSL